MNARHILLAFPLLLTACNPPHMWHQTHVVHVRQPAAPETHYMPERKVCYDYWGDEIDTPRWRERGYQFRYGDHCYISSAPPPSRSGRRNVR